MPNGFAYLVLLSWPLVTILLFRVLPISKAIVWTIVAGYLFLPERTGFDFPILPAIDKAMIPAVSAAVMAWIKSRDPHRPEPMPATPGVKRLFGALLVSLIILPFITALTNAEPVIIGSGVRFIPSLRIYDALSTVNEILVMLIPFMLAYRFLATEAGHEEILKILVLAGVAYSLPIFIEVRLSPQLNTWIYGFFPHSFLQHIRGGGFRPIVFLNHGLWVAIFMATTVLSAAVLWRLRQDKGERLGWALVAVFLFGTLILVKSLGAFLIVLALLPIVVAFKPYKQVLVAATLASVVLLYPLLRGSDLVPVDWITSMVEDVAPERAQSFDFRIQNEDQLLERANLKPFAGWGGWGRSLIYSETTGRLLSVTDGAWIIVIGQGGWLRYLAVFGLLSLPIILLWARFSRIRPGPASTGIALVLAAGLVDLLPNATMTPVTWLLAGALAGRVQLAVAGELEPGAPDHRAPRRRDRPALSKTTRPASIRRAIRFRR